MTKKTSKMHFGIVGAGAIAQTYAQAFATSDLVDLVGVCDVNKQAADAMAERMNCISTSSVDQLLHDTYCEAVILSSPPNTHPALADYFLSRGVHVLCEKPLSVDVAGAQAMLASAQKSSAMLTMASKFRHCTDVIEARSIVASGLIGEIILFENAFTSRVDMTRRWNSDPTISGGGVLIDNGTHSVDIMRYFLGPIAEIQVIEGKRVQDIPVEDTVRMFIRSQKQVMGTIDLSWSINKELPYYLSIYGSTGTVHVGWKESKYRRAGDNDWTVFGKGYDKVQAFRSQLENFAEAARGMAPSLITLADALASVEVIEAAYDAMWRSSWVSVGTKFQDVATQLASAPSEGAK